MAADGNGNWTAELFKKSLALFREQVISSFNGRDAAPALNKQPWIARQKPRLY